MFFLQLLHTFFLFVTFVVAKEHENEIEISGVYIMDKVEGDMQGFFVEHLKSLYQLRNNTKELPRGILHNELKCRKKSILA